MWVLRHNAFTHIGFLRTPVGSSPYYMSVSIFLCLFFSLSLCLLGRLSRFLKKNAWPLILFSACGCRPRVIQYNFYSSIIFTYVCPFSRPQAIFNFCIFTFSSVLGPALQYIYTLVGSSQSYACVSLSLHIYISLNISLSLCLVLRVTFWKSFA